MGLLTFAAIIKDEAKNIEQVLSAALPHCDHAVIMDTGSTDGTQSLVYDAVKDRTGMRLVVNVPFVDFATNRNQVLDAAYEYGDDFVIMISADEYLREGEKLRAFLLNDVTADVDLLFLPIVIDNVRSYQPRIFRRNCKWRYRGVVHEVPFNSGATQSKAVFIHGPWIEHIVSDHESRFENIWEKHIPLLKKELEKNPDDERSLIFLAQSYDALMPFFTPEERAEYAEEAMLLYKKRLDIPTGNAAERNWVEMHMIDSARLSGVCTDIELFEAVSQLSDRDPHRPETALLKAEIAKTVRPAIEVYDLARKAAEVAERSDDIDNSSPVDMSTKWRAHHLAAAVAKQLHKAHPDSNFDQIMRDHIAAGLACGGSWMAFQALMPKQQTI